MSTKPKNPRSVYARFPPPLYKVGDWLRRRNPRNPEVVQVIEYRGPLGRGGEHIYRYRHIDEFGQVLESETSETSLEPTAAPDPLPVPAPAPYPSY